MSLSIIIPYRDRQEHLDILLPRLMELLDDQDYEIIVVEQDDAKKFRRANLLNVGATLSTKKILVFHDVDYYPPDDVQYYDYESNPDVYLPVCKVQFLRNDLTPRPEHDIPRGYRHFVNGVDDNFFGAVSAFRREAFFMINGFSPDFVGWGREDEDLRERVHHYGLSVERHPSQMFSALEHVDSGPAPHDPDWQKNIALHLGWKNGLNRGINNCYPPTVRVTMKSSRDMWVKAKDFEPVVPTFIKTSTFNFDEGDE